MDDIRFVNTALVLLVFQSTSSGRYILLALGLYTSGPTYPPYATPSKTPSFSSSVAPSSKASQSGGGEDGEEEDTDDAKDDIFILDSFGEKSGNDEEVQIEDRMKGKQKEDDASQDLVGSLELLMRHPNENLKD